MLGFCRILKIGSAGFCLILIRFCFFIGFCSFLYWYNFLLCMSDFRIDEWNIENLKKFCGFTCFKSLLVDYWKWAWICLSRFPNCICYSPIHQQNLISKSLTLIPLPFYVNMAWLVCCATVILALHDTIRSWHKHKEFNLQAMVIIHSGLIRQINQKHKRKWHPFHK